MEQLKKKKHNIAKGEREYYRCGPCSAGWLADCRLASHLTKSLFTSCQNSIFLSQQSAETVFFSPAEQALEMPEQSTILFLMIAEGTVLKETEV